MTGKGNSFNCPGVFFLKTPIGEASRQGPADLACAGWNETPPTCHDKPLIRLSIRKRPDAPGNLHCLYGSVKNVELFLNYKR